MNGLNWFEVTIQIEDFRNQSNSNSNPDQVLVNLIRGYFSEAEVDYRFDVYKSLLAPFIFTDYLEWCRVNIREHTWYWRMVRCEEFPIYGIALKFYFHNQENATLFKLTFT